MVAKRKRRVCIAIGGLFSVFALTSLSAERTRAQYAANEAEASLNATLLARMHSFLRRSTDLQFTTSIVVTNNLQQKVTKVSAAFTTRQPNKFRVELSSGRERYQINSDGRLITIYSGARNKYRQLPAQTTVIGGMYTAATLINVAGRMIDFFWAIDFGQDLDVKAMPAIQVGNRHCAGLRVRRFEETFDVWYDTRGEPLPCRLISRRTDGAADVVSTATFEWKEKPTISDELFNFVPPKESRQSDSLEPTP